MEKEYGKSVTRVLDYVRPLFYGNPRREDDGSCLTSKLTSKTSFKTARCKHCLAVLLIRILLFTLVQIRIRILPFTLMRIQIQILHFNLMWIRIQPLTFSQIWTLQCSLNDPLRLSPFHFDADPDPAFHLNAVRILLFTLMRNYADPDLDFHFDADPNPATQNYVDV